jgi:hypothetical protein
VFFGTRWIGASQEVRTMEADGTLVHSLRELNTQDWIEIPFSAVQVSAQPTAVSHRRPDPQRLVIESRWILPPLSFAGKLRPPRLSNIGGAFGRGAVC